MEITFKEIVALIIRKWRLPVVAMLLAAIVAGIWYGAGTCKIKSIEKQNAQVQEPVSTEEEWKANFRCYLFDRNDSAFPEESFDQLLALYSYFMNNVSFTKDYLSDSSLTVAADEIAANITFTGVGSSYFLVSAAAPDEEQGKVILKMVMDLTEHTEEYLNGLGFSHKSVLVLARVRTVKPTAETAPTPVDSNGLRPSPIIIAGMVLGAAAVSVLWLLARRSAVRRFDCARDVTQLCGLTYLGCDAGARKRSRADRIADELLYGRAFNPDDSVLADNIAVIARRHAADGPVRFLLTGEEAAKREALAESLAGLSDTAVFDCADSAAADAVCVEKALNCSGLIVLIRRGKTRLDYTQLLLDDAARIGLPADGFIFV